MQFSYKKIILIVDLLVLIVIKSAVLFFLDYLLLLIFQALVFIEMYSNRKLSVIFTGAIMIVFFTIGIFKQNIYIDILTFPAIIFVIIQTLALAIYPYAYYINEKYKKLANGTKDDVDKLHRIEIVNRFIRIFIGGFILIIMLLIYIFWVR